MIITDMIPYIILGWLAVLSIVILEIRRSQVNDYNVFSKEINRLDRQVSFYEDLWGTTIQTANKKEYDRLVVIHDEVVKNLIQRRSE